VVSWGYESDYPSGSQFIDHHEWQGTRDLAAFLATPAAIAFQAEHDWPAVRAACRALASATRDRLNALTGQAPLCPDSPQWFAQLFTVRLPDSADCTQLKARLWDEFCIELPLHRWNDIPLLRVSLQGYNTQADVDTLVDALGGML
jgi:isopenicillin-N epimerase